jgi:hypothetical protein
MNDHDQETLAPRKGIPEERKHHIMVLLARIIQQRLTAPSNSKENATGKGLEPRMTLRHDSRVLEPVAYSDTLGAEQCRV